MHIQMLAITDTNCKNLKITKVNGEIRECGEFHKFD